MSALNYIGIIDVMHLTHATRCTKQHYSAYLPQWWMNIKEKCPIEIPAAHFTKMSFIPTATNDVYKDDSMYNYWLKDYSI